MEALHSPTLTGQPDLPGNPETASEERCALWRARRRRRREAAREKKKLRETNKNGFINENDKLCSCSSQTVFCWHKWLQGDDWEAAAENAPGEHKVCASVLETKDKTLVCACVCVDMCASAHNMTV